MERAAADDTDWGLGEVTCEAKGTSASELIFGATGGGRSDGMSDTAGARARASFGAALEKISGGFPINSCDLIVSYRTLYHPPRQKPKGRHTASRANRCTIAGTIAAKKTSSSRVRLPLVFSRRILKSVVMAIWTSVYRAQQSQFLSLSLPHPHQAPTSE